MEPSVISREVFETTIQEHHVLREKLREIHHVLAGPKIAVAEMMRLLHEFHNDLAVHFKSEEADGFFEEITKLAPRLTVQANKLCVEHEQML